MPNPSDATGDAEAAVVLPAPAPSSVPGPGDTGTAPPSAPVASADLRAAVEAAYREGQETVAVIAARFAVREREIYAWARAGGWPLRRPATTRRKPARKAGRRRASYTRIVRRLYAVLERNLTRMEQDMEDNTGAAPADGERTTRTLQGMIRSVDKLRTMESRADAGATADAADAAASAREADRLRLELASRLIEMCERRHSPAGDR